MRWKMTCGPSSGPATRISDILSCRLSSKAGSCCARLQKKRHKRKPTPPVCPVCQKALSQVSHGHQRSFECKFGTIRVERSRGYCKRCRKWRFPADTVLGLEESAGYSPRVQEMAALLASKMPVSEASAVLEHLTGVKLPRATLDREARRQGQRAQKLRRQQDEQARQNPRKAVQSELVLEAAGALVIG